MLRLAAALVLLAPIARGQGELERFEFESPHMGTLFRIALYAPDAEAAEKAADDAFALAARLERSFSDYQADSELMRLIAKREAVASPELFDILTRSQAIAKATRGAFDITNGPHTRNWRRARITGELPSPAAIAAAKAATGWKKLKLDPSTRRVTLTAPGMYLDLGGIAKGYTADAMLDLLKKKHRLPIASIAAGGDIAAGDPPPGKEGWRVGIAPGGKAHSRVLILSNRAVSTSGDAEQKLEIGGKSYSHIVDPATGLGLTTSQAVSVIGPSATETDAYATAFSVATQAISEAAAKARDLEVIRSKPVAEE